MSRIAVIGASGLLGQFVVDEAQRDGHEVLGTFRNIPAEFKGVKTEFMDITNYDQTESVLGHFEPDKVVLAAALTNVDLCEKNPSEAWNINAEGTLNVASFCKSIGAKLLYISTDYVFNGVKKERYSEWDNPDPLSIYAQTKLEGERITLDSSSTNLVCRVSTIYGWNRISKKKNFVTWVIESLRERKSVSLFSDQFVSPTYAPHCAHVLLKLLESDAHGIYHTSGPDCLSRYEIGLRIAEVFDLDRSLIKAISAKDSDLVARRPCCSCLDVEKTEKKLGFGMLSLIEGLKRMRQEESS